MPDRDYRTPLSALLPDKWKDVWPGIAAKRAQARGRAQAGNGGDSTGWEQVEWQEWAGDEVRAWADDVVRAEVVSGRTGWGGSWRCGRGGKGYGRLLGGRRAAAVGELAGQQGD